MLIKPITGELTRWIRQRHQAYGRACLLLALFLAPVVVHPRVHDSYNLVKATTLWTLGALTVWFVVSWSTARQVWLPRVRLGAAALAYLAAFAMATAYSFAPAVSLLGERWGGLFALVLYAGLMAAVVALYWEHPAHLGQLAWAAGCASVVLAGVVLLQAAGIDRLLWRGPVAGTLWDYPVGTIGHSNFSGAYLGICSPLLAYLALTARRRAVQSALGAALALNLLALWHTQSRGGMLAALVGLGAMALACRGHLGRRTKAALAVAGAALVAAVSFLVLAPLGHDSLPERLAGVHALRTKTLQYRAEFWQAAGRMFLDHPVVGTGPDNFYAYYGRYRSAPDRPELDAYGANVDKPHNVYLEQAATTGALGAGSYLVLVGLAFRYGYRRSRELTGEARLLLASFLGALAAYLAQAFFSLDVPPVAVMGWIALGAIAVIADPAAIAARSRARCDHSEGGQQLLPNERGTISRQGAGRRGFRSTTLYGLSVVALIVCVALGLRPLRADVKADAGDIDTAIALNPLDSSYPAMAGEAYRLAAASATDEAAKTQLLHQARDYFRRALRLKPGYPVFVAKVSAIETMWAEQVDPSRFVAADRAVARVVATDPSNAHLKEEERRYLLAAKGRSVNRWEAETRLHPEHVGSWVNLGEAYFAVHQPRQAKAAAERALALEPRNIHAARLLVRAARPGR